MEMTTWIFLALSIVVSTIYTVESCALSPDDPPDFKFEKSCRLHRIDTKGGSLEYDPFPNDQGIGDCYAQAAALVETAALHQKGFKASALYVGTQYVLKDPLTVTKGFTGSSETSAIDGGNVQQALYASYIAGGICPRSAIEDVIDRWSSDAADGIPQSEKRRVKYRAFVNLIFKSGSNIYAKLNHSPEHKITAADIHSVYNDLKAEWLDFGITRDLPQSLLPTEDKFAKMIDASDYKNASRQAVSSGDGIRWFSAQFTAKFVSNSCPKQIQARALPIKRIVSLWNTAGKEERVGTGVQIKREQFNRKTFDELFHYFDEDPSVVLPVSVSMCAGNFDFPKKHLKLKTLGCSDKSGHGVNIVGAVNCDGERQFLLRNSWGTEWCKSMPGIQCERRGGKLTGQAWVTEEWLSNTSFGLGYTIHKRDSRVLENQAGFSLGNSATTAQ